MTRLIKFKDLSNSHIQDDILITLSHTSDYHFCSRSFTLFGLTNHTFYFKLKWVHHTSHTRMFNNPNGYFNTDQLKELVHSSCLDKSKIILNKLWYFIYIVHSGSCYNISPYCWRKNIIDTIFLDFKRLIYYIIIQVNNNTFI